MFDGPAIPHEGLGTFDYAVVTVYLGAMFAMALYFAKRQTSTDEFFLASRGMPWFAVGLSIVASLLSTLSYLSSPGEMIKNGIGMFWQVLAVPLSMAVVLLLWVPFFMRLRMTSAYEYLELRFNYASRALAAVLFIMLRLGWMAMIVYASSIALAEMTQPNLSHLEEAAREEKTQMYLYSVIAAVGLFATVYTAIGGMRAVIWTDVVQFITLFVGALVTIGYVMVTTGTDPTDWWATAAAIGTDHTETPPYSFNPTVRITITTVAIGYFFWTVCTHVSDQVVLQRYFTTKSLKAARRSYVVRAIADISVGILLALCGLCLLAFYIAHPEFLKEGMTPTSGEFSDKVFPYFIAHQLPIGIGGLILAALIAAAMSSIDSGVNSVSTVVTTDFFERLKPKGKKRLSALTMARVLTLVVGFSVTLLAYGVDWIAMQNPMPQNKVTAKDQESANNEQAAQPDGSPNPESADQDTTQKRANLMELMFKVFNMFLGPLAGFFLIGMFIPRCRSRSVILAVLGGMFCSIVWSWLPELSVATHDWPLLSSVWSAWAREYGAGAAPTFTLSVAFPVVATIVFGLLLGYLIEPAGDHSGSEYTWYAVMQRKVDESDEF